MPFARATISGKASRRLARNANRNSRGSNRYLERDSFMSNRHRALVYCLSMIFFGKPVSTFPDHALRRRKFALRQSGAVVVDLGWPREPDLFLLRMIYDVLQRLAQHAQPVGLTHDHRVQRDAAYERLFCRLTQELFELADDEVTELLRRVMPHQDLGAVVDLERIRHAHESAGARFHPERLIVGWPIHQEIEPDLLQQVRRPVRRGHPWRHPSSWRLAGRAFDRIADVLQEPFLVGFPHVAVALGVGAAMPDEFIAARLECIDDTGRIVEHCRVDEMGRRQVEFIEEFEAAPNADPVAVVPPGERPGVRSNSGHGQEMTFARTEREMFDVEAEIDREPLAVRPGVVRAVNDRRVSITIVIGKVHLGIPSETSPGVTERRCRPSDTRPEMSTTAAVATQHGHAAHTDRAMRNMISPSRPLVLRDKLAAKRGPEQRSLGSRRHAEVQDRSAFPVAGMGGGREGLFSRRRPRL